MSRLIVQALLSDYMALCVKMFEHLYKNFIIILTAKFLITQKQQFQPLRSGYSRYLESASIPIGQTLRANVVMQLPFVTAHKHDART